MSWLDQFLQSYDTVQIAGVAVAKRPVLNFLNDVTAADDAVNNRTNLTLTSSGGSNVPDKPAAAGTIKYYLLQVDTSGNATWVVALQNMIGAAETVAISGSGNGTFECGATWTTSGITATPACNSAGVTAATLTDTNGGSSNVFGLANPLSSPGATYSKSTAGQTVGITLAQTRDGFSLTSNTLASSWIDRYYVGSGTGGGGTSATNSGNNASLVGDTGTLTGTLASFGVGSSFNIPAGAAAYWYLWVAHTSSAMTFKAGGAPFAMTRVGTNVSYSNQFSVSHGFDLYVSNQLTQAYTVVRDT